MIITALDPGAVNFGFASYDTSEKKILHCCRIQLVEKVKHIKSEAEILNIIWTKLFCNRVFHEIIVSKSDVVLIEIQMKRKYIIMSHIIASILFMMQKEYHFVAPMSVKSMFGTSKKSHDKNKAAAVQLMKKIFPSIFNSKSTGIKKDDIADSLLMTLYWARKTDPNFHIPGMPKSQKHIIDQEIEEETKCNDDDMDDGFIIQPPQTKKRKYNKKKKIK